MAQFVVFYLWLLIVFVYKKNYSRRD